LFLLRRKGFAGKGCVHLREIFEKGTFPFLLYRVLFQQKNMSVIAISHAVKNRLPEKLRQHASVIYNGIAVPAEEKKYPHKNSVELLYLGRVVPWKGCHLLIDILALLHKKYPGRGIELSIVGDTMYWSSEYRDRLLERIGALNLSSFCHIYPHTDSAETFFLTHDIFCNASVNEPFGRSIAEAQGYGLPVVAFASGGVPEIVITNETGILVPYPDCQAFAEACGRLIDEPGLAVTMGKAARKRASALFDRERQMPLICQFLRERISLQ
jgi:glycosyltransferase involved in cell wall biosynthesis